MDDGRCAAADGTRHLQTVGPIAALGFASWVEARPGEARTASTFFSYAPRRSSRSLGWNNNKQTHQTYGRDSKLRITNNNNTGLLDHDRLLAWPPFSMAMPSDSGELR